MRNPIQLRLNLMLVACFGFLVAACGSNSNSNSHPNSNSRYAWNPTPTKVAAVMNQTITPNIAPNPIALAKWTASPPVHGNPAGQFVMASGGPGGAKDFELTGTGTKPTKQLVSPTIAVRPHMSDTFSAWVDGSKITRGATIFFISNPAGTATYDEALIPPGPPGRYGFTADIPNGVTRIRMGFYTHACVLPKGQKIKFSQPALDIAKRVASDRSTVKRRRDLGKANSH